MCVSIIHIQKMEKQFIVSKKFPQIQDNKNIFWTDFIILRTQLLSSQTREHFDFIALLYSGISRNFQLIKISHILFCIFYQRLRNPERTNHLQKTRLSKNVFSFWLIISLVFWPVIFPKEQMKNSGIFHFF
jgi:hypothetical protein